MQLPNGLEVLVAFSIHQSGICTYPIWYELTNTFAGNNKFESSGHCGRETVESVEYVLNGSTETMSRSVDHYIYYSPNVGQNGNNELFKRTFHFHLHNHGYFRRVHKQKAVVRYVSHKQSRGLENGEPPQRLEGPRHLHTRL